MKRRYK